MEQIIIPAGNSSHFKDINSSEMVFRKKEDPQELANLFGKALDDLDIILFQKEAVVPSFKDATDEEKDLIKNTKVKSAYVVLAIDKELNLLKFDLMDAKDKSEIVKKLEDIKAGIIKTKGKKFDPIKSLNIEELEFMRRQFNKRFESILDKINDASEKALAN